MERLISKLNRPPVRFNRDGFLKSLNKNSKEAIIAMRDSPELKKAVIVDVLQRFHKIIKSAKFPDDVSLVPNGFFLYGGQVIQEIFQQTKKIVDPKIGAAMMMTWYSGTKAMLHLSGTERQTFVIMLGTM